MDPISLIGGIASVAQLIVGVTQTINTLVSLRGRFLDADTSITLFINQLKTVKHALSRIKVWAQNHASTVAEADDEFGDQFNVAQENVEVALQALEKDIQGIVKDMDNPNITTMTRAKCLWKEDSMKVHNDRLRDTVFLLQVLVQAVQWYIWEPVSKYPC
jgi:hypothetical protein